MNLKDFQKQDEQRGIDIRGTRELEQNGRKRAGLKRGLVLCSFCSLCLMLNACPPGPDPNDPGTTTTTLTLMSANLLQTYNHPRADGLGWQSRYAPIGPWMSENHVTPDVIGVQEASGWWWCPTDYNALKDYESIAYLLQNLKNSTGVDYRIAYFLVLFHFGQSYRGIREGSSTAGGCQTMAGNALLYNPNTVEHILESGPRLNHDSTDPNISLRRSLPCCNVRPDDAWVCDRLDGARDDEKCANNPSGLAWSFGAGGEGALARFRRLDGDRTFHVYNAHWAVGKDLNEISKANTKSFVSQMEGQLGSPDRWLPPLFMGDFNIPDDQAPSTVWPDEFVVMTQDQGMVAIFQGNFLSWPSHVVARATRKGSACSYAGIDFSDHCFPWVSMSVTENN